MVIIELIEELIVVEGKNDAQAVKRALGEVDVIWTEGYGLSEAKLTYIEAMAQRRGVIVFTDPDSVGEQIRERIRKRVPMAKHVYLAGKEARKLGDIGVENATPEAIRRAFAHIQREQASNKGEISSGDLVKAGLAGRPGSAEKRLAVGQKLGLGDTNAKQFLHRLNRFGITIEQFWQAVEEIDHGKCS